MFALVLQNTAGGNIVKSIVALQIQGGTDLE